MNNQSSRRSRKQRRSVEEEILSLNRTNSDRSRSSSNLVCEGDDEVSLARPQLTHLRKSVREEFQSLNRESIQTNLPEQFQEEIGGDHNDLLERSRSRQRRKSVESELHRLDSLALEEDLPEGFLEGLTLGDRLLDHQHTPIIINIVHGSIWGVVARRGINQLTGYGGYLGGVVWSNFSACLIMGILISSDNIWTNLNKKKSSIPLYVGMTTGFCGTFSSFSSLILESFLKCIDTSRYPNGGYGIMEFLSVVLAQVAISIFGYSIGKELMQYFDERCFQLSLKMYHIFEMGSLGLGIGLYIADIVLVATVPSSRLWTFSILFAPFGALLRYGLGRQFNLTFKNFPLGTFLANVIGSLLLSIFTLLAKGQINFQEPIIKSIISCQVLVGLDDGFCGALTTVSTFVVEIIGLKPIRRYIYGITSIIVSFCLFILTLGSYNWTHGLTNQVC